MTHGPCLAALGVGGSTLTGFSLSRVATLLVAAAKVGAPDCPFVAESVLGVAAAGALIGASTEACGGGMTALVSASA